MCNFRYCEVIKRNRVSLPSVSLDPEAEGTQRQVYQSQELYNTFISSERTCLTLVVRLTVYRGCGRKKLSKKVSNL